MLAWKEGFLWPFVKSNSLFPPFHKNLFFLLSSESGLLHFPGCISGRLNEILHIYYKSREKKKKNENAGGKNSKNYVHFIMCSITEARISNFWPNADFYLSAKKRTIFLALGWTFCSLWLSTFSSFFLSLPNENRRSKKRTPPKMET